ncbi:hypothetical protein [Archangium minus]|uniref:hypothetical protein n=1 Tax=Archangium minus TaxID=83450 RepID=UPI0037BE4E12
MVTAPVIEWHNAYDAGGWEWFQSVAQTAEGGYVGVGERYLLKIDAIGGIEWAIASSAQLSSIKVLADGSYIVAGQLGNGAYLAKYAFDGVLLWEKQYSKGSNSYASTVQPTSDGGFIVSGSAVTTTTSDYDFWLLKVDSLGNKTWEKTFGGAKADIAGEQDNAVQQTSDGGYIVVGSTWTYVTQAYTSDVFVVRTDAFGNLKWQKNYGGTRSDFGYAIQQTRDGGYIVVGHYDYSSDTDAYLLKLDGLGTIQWQKTYGGALQDWGRSVFQTSDGGYILGGRYSFSNTDWDFYLVKTDSLGNISWQNAYGGSLGELGYSLQPTADGGFIFGGYTESFAQTNRDFYLIKLSSASAFTQTGLAASSPFQVRPIPLTQQRTPQ